MGKKVNIRFDKEEKKIIILENAEEGDFFYINDLYEFNTFMANELKNNIINNFKNESEYKKLLEIKQEKEKIESKIKALEQTHQLEKQSLQSAIRLDVEKENNQKLENKETQINDLKITINDLENKINEKNKEINKINSDFNEKLNREIELIIIKKELELKEKYSSENEQLKRDIKLQEQNYIHKIESITKEHGYKLEEQKRQLDSEWSQKVEEEKEWRNKNNSGNVKVVGENFEIWCQNEYQEKMGFFDDCSFDKATKAIHGRKPDFIFTVFDKKINDDSKIELGKVILEMKTQLSTSMDHNKKKNSDHLEKLQKEMQDNNANIGLLVTQLEEEDNFLIRKAPSEYGEIYIVRPLIFVGLLNIIRKLFILGKEVKIQEKTLKDKNKIITEFDELKNEIIEAKSLELFEKSIEKINKNADQILDKVNEIKDEINSKVSIYIDRILRKISDFEIGFQKKIIKKLID